MAAAKARHFYRRPLPATCISLTSEEGKQLFAEALSAGCMNGYFGLAAQFRTQDEPAFCGLSTLVMVLNTLEVDPQRVWKGPWRWYHENMLDCCVPPAVVEKSGITMDQFSCLAVCNTLNVRTVRPSPGQPDDGFRDCVRSATRSGREVVVATYSRKVLDQTGDGHFSPVGGYHPSRDLVLILDTARFKYPPHWVPLSLLWEAMKAHDADTGKPRGYFVLSRSVGEPLVLFRLSAQLCITAPNQQELSKGIQSFLRRWNDWLQQPQTMTEGGPAQVLAESVKHLCEALASLEEGEDILTTQVDHRILDELTSDHQELVARMVTGLEETQSFATVCARIPEILAAIPSLETMGARCTNTWESGSPSDVDDGSSEKTRWTASHFVAMLLLAWPYIKCAGSNGLALDRHALEAMRGVDEALQNEVARLRQQLQSVLGYIQRCHGCDCGIPGMGASAMESPVP